MNTQIINALGENSPFGGINSYTVAAIAVVAYSLCDLTHEALGHGTMALFLPDVHVLSLTTVALSTAESSRMVAAAGPLVNIIVGLILFAFLSSKRGSDSIKYFLWLLATLNLFNGTAYLLYSAIFDAGDWAVVFAGMEPRLVVRVIMAVVGIVLYAVSIRVSATALSRLADEEIIDSTKIEQVSILPYWIGGALLIAGAIPNPISPWLILTSGASSGFGAMAGLLIVPRLLADSGEKQSKLRGQSRRPSIGWLVSAAVTAIIFVFVVGPGIAFR